MKLPFLNLINSVFRWYVLPTRSLSATVLIANTILHNNGVVTCDCNAGVGSINSKWPSIPLWWGIVYLSEMGNSELLPLSLVTINGLNSCYNVLEQHKYFTRYVKFSLIITELSHAILGLFSLSSTIFYTISSIMLNNAMMPIVSNKHETF